MISSQAFFDPTLVHLGHCGRQQLNGLAWIRRLTWIACAAVHRCSATKARPTGGTDRREFAKLSTLVSRAAAAA
ncbi:MAG: hypothetical protein ABJC66_06045 [Gammaproteobacteria bacterium]